MNSFFLRPLYDVALALESLLVGAPGLKLFAFLILAGGVSWWIYVPVHELLHALGCVAAGGAVTELQIAPAYGGRWLARALPFVVPEGDYAGRLTGFDTKGSDLIYLATDFVPYLLTVVLGVPLLKHCGSRRRPVLLAVGLVLGLAPFYSLTGDYYEMGSILTTRALTLAQGDGNPPLFAGIRSDDVVHLLMTLLEEPQRVVAEGVSARSAAAAMVLLSLLVGIILAFGTYAAGGWCATGISRLGSARPQARSAAPGGSGST